MRTAGRFRGLFAAGAGVAVAVLPVSTAVAQDAPPPALDLVSLFPAAVPAGFAPLPDQPGRLGALDAASAAAVLDQSGRVKAEMLVESGFRAGHAKAWSKQDTQEVVVDVLLEFDTQREAESFTDGFLEGRRQTTESFVLPGVPEASGFLRGPQTPSRTSPAQREVVLQRGRVMAIVVVAGFAAYPPLEPAVTMAEAQRAALALVPVEESSDETDPDVQAAATALLAAIGLALVTWQLVSVLREHPVVARRALPWS
jgi:hypothetical protein